MRIRIKNVTPRTGCFVTIFVVSFNLILGGWSILEILSWFKISVPYLAAGIVGFVAGTFTVPIAIIGHILKICNVF